MKILSKSKYMIGLKCPEHLWVAVNDKNSIPEASASSQARMNQGTKIGRIAQKLFPEGIELPEDDLSKNIALTKRFIQKRKPMFEAAFSGNYLYSRADILVPVGENKWDVYEVKSSTKVKPEHIEDLSFQLHCYQRWGLKIRKCYLVHINRNYERQGDIDPKELFTTVDITEQVLKAIEGIEERIAEMQKMIALPSKPDETINSRCRSPYECPLIHNCSEILPKHNIYELYRGTNKAADLFDNGIKLLEKIPNDYKLSDKQALQVKVAKTGKTHVNKVEIKNFLKKLVYPLYYLDFETVSSAIPLFDASKPYQQIPFQFSLHVVDKDGSTSHHEFLSSGKKDPRPLFASSLKKVIGDKGSVVTYNQSFELKILRDLKEFLPSEKEWIDAVSTRVIDLIVPFRTFSYYHPRQKGSCSIKYVLPALVGELYADLDINNGEMASQSFFEVEFNGGENREKVRKDLLAYCKLDTEAMVLIVEKLREIVR